MKKGLNKVITPKIQIKSREYGAIFPIAIGTFF